MQMAALFYLKEVGMKSAAPIGKIFVYGTLMQGRENHGLLAPFIKSVQAAAVRGRLLHLTDEGYPMLFSGDDTIHGELVELLDEAAALAILDPLEEYCGPDQPQNLFERRLTTVFCKADQIIQAWVYACPATAEVERWATGEPVVEGNWRLFMSGEK